MTREILFKAKRVDNGEWVEGLLTMMWREYHIVNPSEENIAYPIDVDTICQYTGLEDKNGNKIWENDVIHYKGQYEEIFTVKYYLSMCRFVFVKKSAWQGIEMDFGNVLTCSEAEVIGNIFDNPKLLGVDDSKGIDEQ